MTHEALAQAVLPKLADVDKSLAPKFRPWKVMEKEADMGPFKPAHDITGVSKLNLDETVPTTVEIMAESPSDAPAPLLLEHRRLVNAIHEVVAHDVN